MNFSEFLTPDNLLFVLVLFGNLVVVVVILILIIRAILRFIKFILRKFFKKKPKAHPTEGVLTDKGEDLGVYVEELEKSKKETASVKEKKSTTHVKTPPLEYVKPVESEKTQEKPTEAPSGSQKEFQEQEKKDIEAGLEKLKHSGQAEEKKSFLDRQRDFLGGDELMPKIKIPVSKKLQEKQKEIVDEPRSAQETPVVDKKTLGVEEGTKVEEKSKDVEQIEAQEKPVEKKAEKAVEQKVEPEKPEELEKVVEQKQETQKDGEIVKKESPLERARAQNQPFLSSKRAPDGHFKSYVKNLEQKKQEKPDKSSAKAEHLDGPASIPAERDLGGEEIALYEKPKPIKDDLMVGRLKDDKEKPEKESFLEKQKEETIKRIPVPKRADVLAKGKNLEEPVLKEEPSASPLERIKEKQKPEQEQEPKQSLGQALNQRFTEPSKTLVKPETGKDEEIALYKKPDILEDDLQVGRLKNQAYKKQELSPIQRAEEQKEAVEKPDLSVDRQAKAYKQLDREKENPLYEKPDFMKDELGVGAKQKNIDQAKTNNSKAKSINSVLFGEKDELTRIQLKHRLRYDPKVWKAGKQSRLHLSRQAREKLEKDLFSKIYGRNISKHDFNRRIRVMKKERAGLIAGGKAGKAETMRKEINFLQKISGTKGDWRR